MRQAAERSVGAARLDTAAGRAIDVGALTYGLFKSILDNKLEQQQPTDCESAWNKDPLAG